MRNTFFILMLVAMLGALATLGVGLVGMANGGEFNRKYGNKLMQLRVIFQGIALAMFALAMISE